MWVAKQNGCCTLVKSTVVLRTFVKCRLLDVQYPTQFFHAYKIQIYIDYLMVGLRYGFYPRVTDVISRTNEE